MKIIKYISFGLSISVIAFNVNCQDINLQYADGSVSMPLNTSSNMTIDSVSGDVNIATTDTAEGIGLGLGLEPTGDSPGISFNVTPNGTTSATIAATISNEAVYCAKSGLWSGSAIVSSPPNNFVTSVSQNVTSNGTNYTLTCMNSFGVNVQNATVSNITTVVNPVVTISASSTTVDSGGSSTVSWAVSNNPDSCTFTGDWPGTINFTKDGPYSFLVENITTAKSYSVLCDNSAAGNSGTQTATISVAGQSSSVWPSCSGQGAYVLNGAEDRTVVSRLAQTAQEYNGYYSNLQLNDTDVEWPGNTAETVSISLERNKYMAAKFTVDSQQEFKHVFQFGIPGNIEGASPDKLTATISECPGDFNVHLNQPKCKVHGGSFRWATTGSGANFNFYCELEKGKTYYFNLIHSDNNENNNYQTTDCPHTYCGTLGAQYESTL
jgi:hypothetical protein